MMGGEISLQSELNVGSTFSIRLNSIDVATLAANNTLETSNDNSTVEFKAATILIVDDIQDNLDLLLANFANTALHVITATNGLEAVNIAKEQSIDLIIMDIRMPIMNGYQAAKEIRTFSSTPIIALTASVMTDDFKRIRSENFDSYLRKPVLKADLFNELSKFLACITIQAVEDVTEQSNLSINDKAQIKPLLLVLETLAPEYEASTRNNNLTEIQAFADAINEAAKQHPVIIFDDFATQLNQAVQNFDIAAIKQTLNAYPALIQQLQTAR